MEKTFNGIAPALLISQIENTAPFLRRREIPATGPLRIYADAREHLNDPEYFTDSRYFDLCLAAHWLTVGTFVPTDVDQAIRLKLWRADLSLETRLAMAERVREAYAWDIRDLSLKWVADPETQEILAGHTGEWLGCMVAAYASLRTLDPKRAEEFAELVLAELDRELSFFKRVTQSGDGILRIKSSYVIAHNFGDGRRVFEAWNLNTANAATDSFFQEFQRREDTETFKQISQLNEKIAAPENHRFFALRKPKCLRQYEDLMLPIGPFLDDWGRKVARHPALSSREVAEVVEHLIEGYDYLEGSVSYTRALAGIVDAFPGGMKSLSKELPARVARTLTSGNLKTQMDIPQRRFEEQWRARGLKRGE